jgi:C-terminal processing protease CtpA/Prc
MRIDNNIYDIISGFNSGTLKISLLTPDGAKNVVLRRASIVLADADIVNRANAGILEIIIHKVSDNSVAIVNEALMQYNPSSIILDIRGASGDDEVAAAKLSGLFLGAVPVMRIIETAVDEVEVVPGGRAITTVPMVVLVSDTTRGTAEAIAASFYENKRGVLVGTPTAGSARTATRIDLQNGGALELLNKSLKTGLGNQIDGRGVFPIVCLSNIRSQSQQDAFFINIVNGEFDARDFNNMPEISADVIRKGCPIITSGRDEDAIAAAVAVKILMDDKVYKGLL